MQLSVAQVEDFMTKFREMEARIAELERANPLVGNVPRGETIRVLDPTDGNVIMNVGSISNDTATGFEVGDGPTGVSSDTFLSVSDNGVGLPYRGWATYKADDVYTITSGSFVAAYRYRVELLAFTKLIFPGIVVQTNPGTTAEFRVSALGLGVDTSAVAVGSGATVGPVDFRWDLTGVATLGAGPYVFELQARRTGGAGNVFVYAPPGCSDGAITGATPTGL